MKTNLLVICLVLFSVVSCKRTESEISSAEIHYKGDTVVVREGSPILSNLKIEQISTKPFSDEFQTVATVKADPSHYAEISVPFEGRISRVLVKIGDRVRAGQPLFEISSGEFSEASKEYIQSLRNYDKEQANYNRKKELFANGIISQRELDEAFAQAENAAKDKESAESVMRLFHVDLQTVKVGQPLVVTSPISGEIAQCTAGIGQYVKVDSEPLVKIVDLSDIDVWAMIKEHYIGYVSKEGFAEIYVENDPNNVINASIANIGSVIDEETRSVQVMLKCDNTDRRLKHGMFVFVHFNSKPMERIVLPSTSIFQGEQTNYVFMATSDPRVFVRRYVKVGNTNDDKTAVCINRGLEIGERVIVAGGFYLTE